MFILFWYFHQDTHLEGKNYIFWALTLAYLSILRMGNQSVTTNPNSNNSSSKIKTAMTEESQFLNYQSIRFVEDSNPPISQQQRCLQGKNLMIEFQKHNVQLWRENKIISKKTTVSIFYLFFLNRQQH